MYLLFASLLTTALAGEFVGPLTILPPGYLAGVNTGVDAALKPFLGTFPTGVVTMDDGDFFVNPVGSQCTMPIPYPKIGQHALCIAQKGVFSWHCQWEATYMVSLNGCANVAIDCNDPNRITRAVNKYNWIATQAGTDNGPEMNRADINTYTQACVKYQCSAVYPGSPPPGVQPVGLPPPRLYDDSMVASITATTTSTSFLAIACLAFIVTLAGVAFFVRRRSVTPQQVPAELE